MSYSVLLKLARYEKRQHYDVPEQSIIIADILESVQYLALHNIEICLSAESYINNKVQNIQSTTSSTKSLFHTTTTIFMKSTM